jgi:hypothetical protein
MENLEKRIEITKKIIHDEELSTEFHINRTILYNQLAIMDTLIDIQKDLRRVKKEYPISGMGPG